MRAVAPVASGYVERDGVKLFWEQFGEGRPTVALLPTWSIADSRHWKFQVPYLARHYRVVTYDGRGCGRSDRPVEPAAYNYLEFTADASAVLDATATARAVLVAFSLGTIWALQLAADEPRRVLGVVCLGPSLSLAPPPAERREYAFDERLATTDGWAKYNLYHWLEGGYDDFLDFFFGRVFTEPHSTKHIEDFVGWGREVDPATLVALDRGLDRPKRRAMRAVCERITAPVLVIQGDSDEITSPGNADELAAITGGQCVTIAGGGHGVQARDPVIVNRLIKQFVDRVAP